MVYAGIILHTPIRRRVSGRSTRKIQFIFTSILSFGQVTCVFKSNIRILEEVKCAYKTSIQSVGQATRIYKTSVLNVERVRRVLKRCLLESRADRLSS